MATPAEINERNRQFWRQRCQLLETADEPAKQIAYRIVSLDAREGIPMSLQRDYFRVLENAAEFVSIVRTDFSQKGGKASKTDALQDLILEIVNAKPTITAGQLLQKLAGPEGAGVVTSIDNAQDVLGGEPRMIHFVNADEKPQEASLTGLKDRLARAKKRVLNPQIDSR